VGMVGAETAMIQVLPMLGNPAGGGAVITLKASGTSDGADAIDLESTLVISGLLTLGGLITVDVPGNRQRVVVDSFATLVLELTTASSTPLAFRQQRVLVRITLRGPNVSVNEAGAASGGGGGGGDLIFKL